MQLIVTTSAGTILGSWRQQLSGLSGSSHRFDCASTVPIGAGEHVIIELVEDGLFFQQPAAPSINTASINGIEASLANIAQHAMRQANATEKMATFQGNIEKAINDEFTFLHKLCEVQREEIDRLNALLGTPSGEGESELSA